MKTKSPEKLVSIAIKTDLLRSYPGVEFTVYDERQKSKQGSKSLVTVYWQNGPLEAEVKMRISKYQGPGSVQFPQVDCVNTAHTWSEEKIRAAREALSDLLGVDFFNDFEVNKKLGNNSAFYIFDYLERRYQYV